MEGGDGYVAAIRSYDGLNQPGIYSDDVACTSSVLPAAPAIDAARPSNATCLSVAWVEAKPEPQAVAYQISYSDGSSDGQWKESIIVGNDAMLTSALVIYHVMLLC